jgi:16S rRNA (guanine527-N7)-methyltransferase
MSMSRTLRELLEQEGIYLNDAVCDQEVWYLQEMLRWNRRINLTAIEDPGEALEKHLIDCLVMLPLLNGDERLLDIGSGAGLPGIPLKLACPTLRVVSVDSVFKKVAFQQHVARHFGFENFEAKSCRIQNLAQTRGYAGAFDLVTARALTHLSQLAIMVGPFLNKRGRVIAMKGPEARAEVAEAETEIKKSGLMVAFVREFKLPVSAAERVLVVLQRRMAD